MKKEVKIKLKTNEKSRLNKFIKKGTTKAREITQARVLLLSDSGKSPCLVSNVLGPRKRTVQNIKERSLESGLHQALYHGSRPGQPTIFNGKARAKITALACNDAPKGYAKGKQNQLQFFLN